MLVRQRSPAFPARTAPLFFHPTSIRAIYSVFIAQFERSARSISGIFGVPLPVLCRRRGPVRCPVFLSGALVHRTS